MGLLSRVGAVPKVFRDDPIYQASYQGSSAGIALLATVGSFGTLGPVEATSLSGRVLAAAASGSRIAKAAAPVVRVGAAVTEVYGPTAVRAARAYTTAQMYVQAAHGVNDVRHHQSNAGDWFAIFGAGLHATATLNAIRKLGAVPGLQAGLTWEETLGGRVAAGSFHSPGAMSPTTFIEGDQILGKGPFRKLQVDLSTIMPVSAKKSTVGGARLFTRLPGRTGIPLPGGAELSNDALWKLTENFNREFGTAKDAEGHWHLFSGTSKFIIRDLPGNWLYGPHSHLTGSSLASPADILNAIKRIYGAKQVEQTVFGIVTKIGGVENPIGKVVEGTYGIQKADASGLLRHFEVELFREGYGESQHVWQHSDVGVTVVGKDVYLDHAIKWITDIGR